MTKRVSELERVRGLVGDIDQSDTLHRLNKDLEQLESLRSVGDGLDFDGWRRFAESDSVLEAVRGATAGLDFDGWRRFAESDSALDAIRGVTAGLDFDPWRRFAESDSALDAIRGATARLDLDVWRRFAESDSALDAAREITAGLGLKSWRRFSESLSAFEAAREITAGLELDDWRRFSESRSAFEAAREISAGLELDDWRRFSESRSALEAAREITAVLGIDAWQRFSDADSPMLAAARAATAGLGSDTLARGFATYLDHFVQAPLGREPGEDLVVDDTTVSFNGEHVPKSDAMAAVNEFFERSLDPETDIRSWYSALAAPTKAFLENALAALFSPVSLFIISSLLSIRLYVLSSQDTALLVAGQEKIQATLDTLLDSGSVMSQRKLKESIRALNADDPQRFRIVTGDGLRVRAHPRLNGRTLFHLERGTVVQFLAKHKRWVRVRINLVDSDAEIIGWVAKKHLAQLPGQRSRAD